MNFGALGPAGGAVGHQYRQGLGLDDHAVLFRPNVPREIGQYLVVREISGANGLTFPFAVNDLAVGRKTLAAGVPPQRIARNGGRSLPHRYLPNQNVDAGSQSDGGFLGPHQLYGLRGSGKPQKGQDQCPCKCPNASHLPPIHARKMVCSRSGPTETKVTGTPTAFSMKAT